MREIEKVNIGSIACESALTNFKVYIFSYHGKQVKRGQCMYLLGLYSLLLFLLKTP